MTLNLAPIAAVAEQYMLDTVRIYRVVDRYFDEPQNKYYPVETDIYSGKAFVGAMGSPAQVDARADRATSNQYEIGLPLTAGPFEPEDYVEVLTSVYDATLPGKLLKVIAQIPGTFKVHTRLAAFLVDSRHED